MLNKKDSATFNRRRRNGALCLGAKSRQRASMGQASIWQALGKSLPRGYHTSYLIHVQLIFDSYSIKIEKQSNINRISIEEQVCLMFAKHLPNTCQRPAM